MSNEPQPQNPGSQPPTQRHIIATSGGSFGEPLGTYFSCGTDDAARYPEATTDIDQLVVQASRSAAPRVLCIMTGSDNRLKNTDVFNEALRQRFSRVGATAETMMLTYYDPDGDSEVRARIGAADIIYVSGGTSHLLIPTLRRRRVDALLADAAEQGTVLTGLSAGLCCWFSRTNSHVTPDFVTPTEGLGWFDALVAPHFDIEPARHKPFHQHLLDNPGRVGLAFDEHTAIEIRGDQYRLHEFFTGGQVHRGHYSETTGHYTFEPVNISEQFAPLNSLGIAVHAYPDEPDSPVPQAHGPTAAAGAPPK